MYQSQRGLGERITQIEIILGQVLAENHPFVEQRPRRHGGHIIGLPTFHIQSNYLCIRRLADHQEFAFKRIGIGTVLATADK